MVEPFGAASHPIRSRVQMNLQQQLVDFLEAARQSTGVPGIGAALVVGDMRFTAAVGSASLATALPLSAESRFQVGCISKVLTSLVALELSRKGILDLDSGIGEYLTEFADTEKGRDITPRHLATHTSGYQGINLVRAEDAYFYSWGKFVEFFRNTTQLFRPGTVFSYEHSECVVLGEIVRRVTSKDVATLAREWILAPLGMTTGSVKQDHGDAVRHVADHTYDPKAGCYKPVRSVPYCNFWSASLADMTIGLGDLARVGEALAGLSACGLGERTVIEARQPAIALPHHIGGDRSERLPRAFGVGCAQYENHLLGHNGSARGQTCGIRFDPVRSVVIVVAANAWQPYLRDVLLDSVAKAMGGAAAQPMPTKCEPSWRLQDSEGFYISTTLGVTLRAQRQADRLSCTIHNDQAPTPVSLMVLRDDSGRLVVQSDLSHLSVGFFHDPKSGGPCMLVGLNAFKKVA